MGTTMGSRPKILVTGAPGVGKTSLLLQVMERIPEIKAAGFVTVEQRGKKGRQGFILKTLDGSETQFATVGKGRGARVGKYLVDVETFEEVALKAIGFQSGVDLYIIDEIGPMEVLSKIFCETAKMLLKNDKVAVLATVAKSGSGFIREVKRLPGVDTIELTRESAAKVKEDLVILLKTAFAPPPLSTA